MWHSVAFDVEMRSARTPKALEALKKELGELIDRIEAETKAVEAELDALRDAAISFAEKEGVQVIAGTEARLRVTGKERAVSPAKGSVERDALEQELRAAGIWDEVATLDPSALEKAVAEGKWGPEINERLKAYLSTEKRIR